MLSDTASEFTREQRKTTMCLRPLHAYRYRNNTDKRPIIGYPPWTAKRDSYEEFELPCGRCFECLQDYREQWLFRCKEELKQHKQSCFITLTYAETDGKLNYRDYQLFMKRLRKHFYDKAIRFIMCGEYGKKFSRPHYHAILFGIDFEDKTKFFIDRSGCQIYLSETLKQLWTAGYSSIGDVSDDTIKYVTKYMTKFDPRPHEVKPFIHMSLRPGIGAAGARPELLATDKFYQDGKYIKLPRAYLNIFERDGIDLTELKENRKRKCEILPDYKRPETKFEKTFKKYQKSLDKPDII